MSGTLTELLARYGYIFIALFMFIESIGIPVPGESALMTAGAVAGSGALNPWGVFVAALTGNVLGGIAGYWMGIRGGHAIVARFGRVLRINDDRMAKAHSFFEKHGPAALILGRYVAIVRSFLGMMAGVSGMPRRKFMLFNLLGGLLWSGIFTAVGFFFGKNLPAFKRELARVGIALGIVLGVVILLFVGWRWYSANRARVMAAMQERWWRFEHQPWVETFHERHPVAWRILIFQFARGEYLALHMAVGFVLCVAAMIIFGVVTEDVIRGAPLTPLDAALADGLRETAGPRLLAFFRFVAPIGGPITTAAIAAISALVLLLRRKWLTLIGWVGAYAGGVILDVLLRRIVRRSELPLSPDLLQSDLLAVLPKGHTVLVVVVFGLLAHSIIRRAGHEVPRMVAVTAVLGLLSAIVLARLFLGLSYLSIETASVAVGALWLATAISGLELAGFRRDEPESLG